MEGSLDSSELLFCGSGTGASDADVFVKSLPSLVCVLMPGGGGCDFGMVHVTCGLRQGR